MVSSGVALAASTPTLNVGYPAESGLSAVLSRLKSAEDTALFAQRHGRHPPTHEHAFTRTPRSESLHFWAEHLLNPRVVRLRSLAPLHGDVTEGLLNQSVGRARRNRLRLLGPLLL